MVEGSKEDKMCDILVILFCVFDGQPCRRKFFSLSFWYFLWKADTGKISANIRGLGFGCVEECIFSQNHMYLMEESGQKIIVDHY